MRRQLAALVALLVLPQLVAAQTLTPGSRVRFSHPGEGTRTGTVVAFTTDTLEVRLAGRGEPARLPLDQLTRLDVSRGKRRHMARAGVGFVVGVGVGAVGGYVSGTNDCSRQGLFCIDRRGSAFLGGAFFGAIGGVIGLVAGVIPTETWSRVPLVPPRVSLIAPVGSHGPAVGLRVAF